MINKKMQIVIMGGEPTLYPFLNYMIDFLYKINNVQEILLFTNGIKNLNFIHFNDKLVISFSYHPTENNKQNIIDNINIIKCKYYISAMMIGKIDIKDFDGFVYPLYIESNNKVHYHNANDELFNRKVIQIDDKLLTITEFSKVDKNFKNRICHHLEYTVDMNLNCQHQCFNEVINIRKFADYVNGISFIKCPFDKCKKADKACLNLFIE